MAWLKGFTYDGIESLDYDLYITSGSVYDAPDRVVDMIKVPGRNGNLAIDRGRFENIDVEYNVYTKDRSQTSFAQNIRDFRNELCSRHEYLRLTDDYNSDEFRLGIYKSGLELDADIDRAGAIKLTFDCKPQRFLTSGETARSIPEWSDLHTDSGSIVTIDNTSGEYAVKSLSTDIVPQQDLNGYDHPWAGGAGKNKLNASGGSGTVSGVTFTNTNGIIVASGSATANIYRNVGTFTPENGVEYILTGCPSGGAGGKYRITLAGYGYDLGSGYTFTGDGQSHNITCDVYTGYPTSGTTLTFKPMIRRSSESDATWEPYENICPITGRDGVSISRTGKNLLNPADTVLGIFWNGNPAPAAAARLIIPCKPSTTYVLSMNGTNALSSVYLKTTKEVPAISAGTDITNAMPYTFTSEAQAKYVVLEFRKTYIKQADIDNLKLQLEVGSTATAYEPFGTEYTVSFGSAGTVYGGTLDVVSGQLTVTHGIKLVNELSWTYADTPSRCSAHITDIKRASGARRTTLLSSEYVCVDDGRALANVPNGSIYNTGTSDWVTIVDARYTTADAFTTAQGSQQIVYPLATPLTYQLTPTQILLMLGNNYLWGNINDISVEYGNGGFYLNNPTLFDSKPLLIVSGYGTLGIGSQSITIENGYPSQVVYIDCESMEAWTETGGVKSPANDLIQNAGDAFPVLKSGMNAISLANTISEVKITPRWWRI